MKKILIMNAVPTNNGDAALVFGLKDKLINKGYDVTISTKRYNTVKRLYPDTQWIKSEDDFNLLEAVIKKIIPIKYILKFKILIKKNKYKNFDIIISAPGGYVNSYYGFYNRLYCMYLIKKYYNTKLIMYSQSVGPLEAQDKKVLDQFINTFDLFMVRDDISYQNVKQYNNILQTNDAAFLLDRIVTDNDRQKVVGISVRQWGHDNRDKNKYKEMIKMIAKKVIDKGYSVEFISTCQGVEGYVDDSKIALEICSEIEDKYSKSIRVIDRYFSLQDLRKYITKYELVIGTRLHMCILSIISGVPAFNISYEVKGKECYKNLRMENYSVDYNDDVEIVTIKLEKFLEDKHILNEIFNDRCMEMNNMANEYFEYMIKEVIEKK